MPQQVSLFDSLQNGEQSPSGGGVAHRKVLTHIYDDIISVENLLLAWSEFVRGKRHKRDVQEFQARLMHHVLSLHAALRGKTYAHGGYRAFKISDPKPRDIHKASVRDRLLHHAIYRVLYPFFDVLFIADSYSCRLGHGTHEAMNRFRTFGRRVSKNNTRTCWVLKCDIKKFFASIDHEVLFSILEKRISDRDILRLLQNVVGSFNSGAPARGLPLGNLTSQILVNVYMNEFDQFTKHELKVGYYVRYADDFMFLSHDQAELREILQKSRVFLAERLKLQLHPDKVFIKTLASGVDFLGWVHFPDHRVLRTSSTKRMLRRLREKAGHTGEEATKASYLGMLSHGNAHTLRQKI